MRRPFDSNIHRNDFFSSLFTTGEPVSAIEKELRDN
jgi:hypothetical protein